VISPLWPEGKSSAIAFSLDDVHPGKSDGNYEAGGDLNDGVLGRLQELCARTEELAVTLFVTPDWREISPVPTRFVSRIPGVNRLVFAAPVLRKGTMALSNHPEFSSFLTSLRRCELALHGLHHVHKGPRVPVEFQWQSELKCQKALRQGLEIFNRAKLPRPRGFCPPAWSAPKSLIKALERESFEYLACSRDLKTAIDLKAYNAGSGLRGVHSFRPSAIGSNGLVHIPVNYQATSKFDRAFQILEAGGLLSIKAHAVENACGHVALDALNSSYVESLSRLFVDVKNRFGESVWWPTFSEIASHWRRSRPLQEPLPNESRNDF
jgi:peptidoglycan/xylan/chitin deacetylase (PgdA/CDA1 family)